MYKKQEKRFGKLAISNLTLYVIITYIAGYILVMAAPAMLNFLTLDMSMVMQGQVWRLVTWVLTPPGTPSLFLLFTLYMYYLVGKSLENVMGDFAYTLFIIGGVVVTIIVSVLVYFIPLIFFGKGVTITPSTYYLYMSTFLAFAVNFPETRFNIFFILPVKVKWLAYIVIGYFVLDFFYGSIGVKAMVLASIANFVIYYFCGSKGKHLTPSEVKRRHAYKTQVKQHTSITRHRCCVCGRTELDGDLTFRFCSKCNGNYEYCSEHIYTHEHVK